MPSLHRSAALALTLALGASPSAEALSISMLFSGSFTQDDDVQFFTFDLAAGGLILVETSSWGAGGFWPALTLWGPNGVAFDAVSGGTGYGGTPGDAHLVIDASANPLGTYYLALSVNPNVTGGADLPGGVPTSSVFYHDGLGNFTGLAATGFCTMDQPGGFYAPGAGPADCVQRTGAWALTLSTDTPGGATLDNVGLASPPAPVSEPASWALALAGLGGLAPFSRKRNR